MGDQIKSRNHPTKTPPRILLSADTFKDIYGLSPGRALVPFSQPGIVTIPLGFVVLIVVSLLTREQREP